MDKPPEKVILAHLSEENNRPQLALDTVKNILDTNKRLQETGAFLVASQKEMVADFPLQTMLNVKIRSDDNAEKYLEKICKCFNMWYFRSRYFY